jgi:hypothetical protein
MAAKKGKGKKKVKVSDLKATKGGSVKGGAYQSKVRFK